MINKTNKTTNTFKSTKIYFKFDLEILLII
nr:MAG TPA: hypothetical protein [Caudoviricetes sp.]